MFELNNFDSIQIGIASPERIREWSYGEVTKSETINYRTQKPEMGGLFCERIFGPVNDYQCHCGKYRGPRYKGIVCDKCGVEITKKTVRRERMGHIELAAPVAHIWYRSSKINLMLDMSPKDVEAILAFSSHVVLDPGKTQLQYKQVLTDAEKSEAEEKYGAGSFKTGIGAEAIKELLMAIDLEKESEELHKIINEKNSAQKRQRAVKRLEVVEAFRRSKQRPEWMILDVLPVLPPNLRPMVALDGGRFAASDLNELYRRVINRNNRLKKYIEYGAPDIMIRNEKRMLQEAVDALIENDKKSNPVKGASNRALKSLSQMLKGKQGRFRQNLLGKRVDFSGRSVIVVGPELKLYQCGLPKEMAIELFKPFVMAKLLEKHISENHRAAKNDVDRKRPEVWDILEEVIKEHPVLLNRAPTLHRLSIQAFEPVLIEGRAIKLHPLVCGAFNADFDGDQMAIHVPLSIEAQAEARFLMLASNNILKLADGKPVMNPSQDMVMGSYYLNLVRRRIGKKYNANLREDENGELYEGHWYISEDEAMMAHQLKIIGLQDEIVVRRTVKTPSGKEISGLVHTTAGKIIFNQNIPQDLGFVKRETDEDYLRYEIELDKPVKKKDLSKIVDYSFKVHGAKTTGEVLDRIKALGYKYSTLASITTSVFDMHVPETKQAIIKAADEEVLKINKFYKRGYITDAERYKKVIEIWGKATQDVTDELKKTLDDYNPIWMMADSGARGSIDQIKQLAAMRGNMADPNGRTIEIPVKSNFREGLSILEYFISSHGGRKGMADTALKTANSGYLTRRLVDVSHEVVVTEEDCFASSGEKPKGMVVSAIRDINGKIVESLADRIKGRYTVDDVVNPATGEVIVPADSMITDDQADAIDKAGIESVEIRSIFTCKCKNGICAKCYGKDMSNGQPVRLGEAVGVIAAQSIGEPGTQLTMRTFHTGGIASTGDITQGLPRVEELFEARKPKHTAIVCESAGIAHIVTKDKLVHVQIEKANKEIDDIAIPFGTSVIVKEGETVEPGTILTSGSAYPQDILRTQGIKGVQDYILKEVQMVYRSQSVEINDKHVEVIIRQMLKKVQIENPGDTDILPGEKVDLFKFEEKNLEALEQGKRPAIGKRALLGITDTALATESFLSAASFQETTSVLTDAAIKNKIDPLVGLKENVIIGKLIPAGTGVEAYRRLSPQVIASAKDEDDDNDGLFDE